MEKSFEIENYSKFKSAIEKIIKRCSIRELERRADLKHTTLNKLLNSKKYKMSSNNIEKILNEIIKELHVSPEEVGIKVTSRTKFSIRLETLLKENNMTQKKLAEELKVGKSTVSNWINGRNEPTLTLAKEMAQRFNVHYLYLLGEIDTKNVFNSTINEMFGLSEDAIDNIAFCVNANIYGKKQHDIIYQDFGFRYTDIVDFVVSNLPFFDKFYLEAVRTMTYHTTGLRNNFDEFFNTVDLDFDFTDEEIKELNQEQHISSVFSTPYRVNIETLSKAVLCEEINKMFDDFIDKKLKEIQNKKREDKNNKKQIKHYKKKEEE